MRLQVGGRAPNHWASEPRLHLSDPKPVFLTMTGHQFPPTLEGSLTVGSEYCRKGQNLSKQQLWEPSMPGNVLSPDQQPQNTNKKAIAEFTSQVFSGLTRGSASNFSSATEQLRWQSFPRSHSSVLKAGRTGVT